MVAKRSVSQGSSPATVRIVNCPQCGNPVPWTAESRYRPFCSQRCKMIDLGAWAAEKYRVPAVEKDDDGAPQEGDEPRSE